MDKLLRTFNSVLLAASLLFAAPQAAFDAASIKQLKSYTNADFRTPTFLPGGRFTSIAPLDMVIAAAWPSVAVTATSDCQAVVHRALDLALRPQRQARR